MEDFSLLTPLGYQRSPCGYCKGADGSTSYYCHGYRNMRPEDYECLANRMWRRSGTTYYKPDSKNACCPHYTIRLDANDFKASRNQKKTANKFSRYVIGNDYLQKAAKLFPKSREEKKKRKGEFEVCQRIGEPEWEKLPTRIGVEGLEDVVPAHRFQVTLESDAFTEEKYALFAQYQRVIHKEGPSRISRPGFKSFLCSGLARTTYAKDGKPRPMGSYHQCYRIDGQLIAIAVIDLLPHAVSSVYLIYHTDFQDLELGKLSALREIALAKEYGYRYYYMGYYIHSCTKMRYKRTFKPTYVLDPESYDWTLFDDSLLKRFDNRKYVSLSRERRLDLEPSDPDPEEVAAESMPSSLRENHNSVFRSGMTGLEPLSKIMESLAPSHILFFYEGGLASSSAKTWNEADLQNPHSLLGRLVEFVACTGIENSVCKGGHIVPALEWIHEDNDPGED